MKKNNKGFTLMEMLIVVAIIAVLIAIAIPTFTSSLNKARVATDKANIRSGYASVMADVLTNKYESTTDTADAATTYTYMLNKDGSVVEGATGGTYACFGNTTDDEEIAGVQLAGGWSKGATVTYTYTVSSGKIAIAVSATGK